jgi:voltage-gated potassium channel
VTIGLLVLLSLVVLGFLAFAPLPASTEMVLNNTEDALCAVFFLDFLRSLRRAEDKWGYVLRGGGWADLLGSIPFGVFAVFRLARLFRIVRAMRMMRGQGLRGLFMDRLAESTLLFTLVTAIVLIFVMGAVVAWAEHKIPSANIQTYPEALWWAVVTITTVGYGDYYPVTAVGRMAAVILMLCGLGIIGVLSSYLATTFITLQTARAASRGQRKATREDDGAHADDKGGATGEGSTTGRDAELAAIRAELAALRKLLEERHHSP